MSTAVRAPSATELLAAWEHAWGRSPADQAQALVALADPDADPHALAGLSVGRRDARLLALRARTFGPRLSALARCPGCSDLLELDIGVADFAAGPTVGAAGLTESSTPGATTEPAGLAEPAEVADQVGHPSSTEPLTLRTAGFEVRFRLPTATDLAAISSGEAVAARLELLGRCVLDATEGSQVRDVAALPTGVVDEIVKRMARADPQADMLLDLTCPSCHHDWEATLDIASFLWGEIEVWAARLLRDVHALASAYGWREADILALTPRRRQAYLEMIRA